MKYKILLREFLKISENQTNQRNKGLETFINDGFFSAGEGNKRNNNNPNAGEVSEQNDNNQNINAALERLYLDLIRSTYANNKPYMGLVDPKDPEFDQKIEGTKRKYNNNIVAIRELLIDLFGDEKTVEQLAMGFNQMPNIFLKTIPQESLLSQDELILSAPGKDQWKSNLYQDKDNTIKMKVTVEKYPIKDTNNKIVGYLQGPVEATFKLMQHPKTAEWGFQLIQLETDNDDIEKMYRGDMFSEAEINFKYVNDPQKSGLAKKLAEGFHDYNPILAEKISSDESNILRAIDGFPPSLTIKQNIIKELDVFLGTLEKNIEEKKREWKDLVAAKQTQTTSKEDPMKFFSEELDPLLQLQATLRHQGFGQDNPSNKAFEYLAQTLSQSQLASQMFPPSLKNEIELFQNASLLLNKHKAVKELQNDFYNLQLYLNDPTQGDYSKLQKAEDFFTKYPSLLENKSDKASAKFASFFKNILSEVKKYTAPLHPSIPMTPKSASLRDRFFSKNTSIAQTRSPPSNINAMPGPSNQNDANAGTTKKNLH